MYYYFYYGMPAYNIIKLCFKKFADNQFESKGYCDVSDLFSNIPKQIVLKGVQPFSEEIVQLYAINFPKTKDDLKVVETIYKEKMDYGYIDSQESFAILFWCFKIFKGGYSFEKNQSSIMNGLMKFLCDDLQLSNNRHYGSIIYDNEKVIVHVIDDLNGFLEKLKEYPLSNDVLFYRGQSKTSYHLIPSILRRDSLKKSERSIYQELLINCPNDFKGFSRHIDYLVKMQHYGLPTRLLDITRNPLVALYFACCDNPKSIGEVFVFSPSKEQIKYEDSDTITMLASLPLFSFEDQNEIIDSLSLGKSSNAVDRFVYEIQIEKPGFQNKIRWTDLEDCFVVLPRKDNGRIVKQDGAFILCGINSNIEKHINEKMRLKTDNKMTIFLISNKKTILDELDLLSINESSLFPEIDHVSKYVANKYS